MTYLADIIEELSINYGDYLFFSFTGINFAYVLSCCDCL